MANNNSTAYDLSLFEPPRVKPAEKKPQQTKKSVKRNTNKKTRKKTKKKPGFLTSSGVSIEVGRKSKVVTIKRQTILQVAAPVVLCLIFLPVLLMAKSDIYELDQQIADLEAQIEIQEGESVRLNAELSSMLSSARIEDIAENELGMVKAESYQITYIDLSEGDKIVVSGDKIPGEDDKFTRFLNKLFAFTVNADEVAESPK